MDLPTKCWLIGAVMHGLIWSDLDINIIKKSFIQTGVNNEGNVDPNNLHSKLQDLLADVSPEELQKKVDEGEKMPELI